MRRCFTSSQRYRAAVRINRGTWCQYGRSRLAPIGLCHSSGIFLRASEICTDCCLWGSHKVAEEKWRLPPGPKYPVNRQRRCSSAYMYLTLHVGILMPRLLLISQQAQLMNININTPSILPCRVRTYERGFVQRDTEQRNASAPSKSSHTSR